MFAYYVLTRHEFDGATIAGRKMRMHLSKVMNFGYNKWHMGTSSSMPIAFPLHHTPHLLFFPFSQKNAAKVGLNIEEYNKLADDIDGAQKRLRALQ